MLVSMKEILLDAKKNNYGVTAPNILDYKTVDVAIETAEKMKSPVILDAVFDHKMDMKRFIRYAAEKATEATVPVAINLDHGGDYEDIIKALAMDFTSVMVDRSFKPFEENVKEVSEIVKVAHALGKSVEAELGHVGTNVDSGSDATGHGTIVATDEERKKTLTRVDEAIEFVKLTGVDCLAVAIGTVHGLYPKGFEPKIEFDLLHELNEKLDVPLVVHGGSGSGDENLAKMCREGINKVNICNDLLKKGRENIANNIKPENETMMQKLMTPLPSYYLGYGEMLEHYMELLGSARKA